MTTFEKLMAGGTNGEPIIAGQTRRQRVPRPDGHIRRSAACRREDKG